MTERYRLKDAGYVVAFTIDGPRGPKYVAKPGACACGMTRLREGFTRTWPLVTIEEMRPLVRTNGDQ